MAKISDRNAEAIIKLSEAVSTWIVTTKYREAANELSRIILPILDERILSNNG